MSNVLGNIVINEEGLTEILNCLSDKELKIVANSLGIPEIDYEEIKHERKSYSV